MSFAILNSERSWCEELSPFVDAVTFVQYIRPLDEFVGVMRSIKGSNTNDRGLS